MKTTKFIAGIVVLIMFLGLQEADGQQWAFNGTHIYNTNTGNVGIGTGALFTPTEKLHLNNASNTAGIMVESSYTGTTMKALGYFRIKNTATGDMFNMVLRKNGADHEMLQSCYDATAAIWREYAYYNYGTRKYEMRSGILDAEFKNSGHFLLTNTGNVGIKTTTPAANLHVAETSPGYTAIFGTSISHLTGGTNVSIGDDNSYSYLYLGQSINNKGYLAWDYDANPSSAFFKLGTYGGTNNLVLQNVGGNVGIHTTTPSAALDVYTSSYNYARLGDNDIQCNYFYHAENPDNGDGQAAIYAYRTCQSANDGTSYSPYNSNTAIKGFNYDGNAYTFGTTGYANLIYLRSGGVLGSSSGATWWGALGYRDSGGGYNGGYFTSYDSGSGKSGPQSAHAARGIGVWGDLFGADIHGVIYGIYAEGEQYALYSHGTTYKDDLDVHLQKNKGVNTVMYTHVSTDATIQTCGTATLSSGRASIAFDPAFASVISSDAPVVVTVTPIGESNGVYLSDVTSAGFTVVENQSGKSNVTVNYIAVGKRAGYEQPQLAKEVIDAGYVNKLSRGLHNDNDLETDGEGLYFENGELFVGRYTITEPKPVIPVEPIIEQKENLIDCPDKAK